MCDLTRRCLMWPGLRGTILTPESLALLPAGLLGQAPNGIQIVASVTVEFVRGGETEEAGSIFCQVQQLSSVKSAELCRDRSSVQTHSWFYERGVPILLENSTAKLLLMFPGLWSIMLWAPPTTWLVFTWRTYIRRGLKERCIEGIDTRGRGHEKISLLLFLHFFTSHAGRQVHCQWNRM